MEIRLLFSLDALTLHPLSDTSCHTLFLKKGFISLNLAQGPPCVKNSSMDIELDLADRTDILGDALDYLW